MKTCKMTSNDLLLIVDPQNDFMPQGSLGVAHADHIIPVMNDWIAAAQTNNTPIVVSRDWHPLNHCSFKEYGGPWPVHCVQESSGAEFDKRINIPNHALIVNKAHEINSETYSAISGHIHETTESFIDWLKSQKIKRIWIQGLCLDYCVLATAIESHSKGYQTCVVLPATQAVSQQSGYKAILDMKNTGIIIDNGANPWLEI